MPIYGLTDASPTFREVGRIRKGGPKTDPYKPGPNLEYFRVTFREDEQQAAETFRLVYGEQPTLINVRLAFNNIADSWDAWYTCYLKGGMLGRADGKKWNYLRDYRTHQILVKDGVLTALGEQRGIKLEFDPELPVYFYRSERKKQDVPVYAKPEGRLRVILPELGRYVFMTVLTHSLHDIRNISGQLAGIAETAQDLGVKLSQVPLVLSRRVSQISKPIGNGRGMADEWLIHLEVHPDFAPLALRALNRMTLQALEQPVPAIASLPEPEEEPEDELSEVEDDGEVTPGRVFGGWQPGPVQPEPKPNGNHRPYPPEKIRVMMAEAVTRYNLGQFTPRDKEEEDQEVLRMIVVTNLERCFAGEENVSDKRHAICLYLFGEGSSKELDFGQLLALKRWLNARPDSGGDWLPDGMACKEAKAIYEAALELEQKGQMKLGLENGA